MCISAQMSINVFVIGILLIIILNIFGNKDYKKYNLFFSYIFLFVLLMQLVDYLIWNDINCSNGLNKFAGIIGPLFNLTQPLLVYFLIKKHLKIKTHKIFDYINYLYLIFIILYLGNYYLNNNLCSKLINKNINWAWYNTNFESIMFICYLVVLFFNSISSNNLFVFLSIMILYVFLIFTNIFKKGVAGEFWCFTAPFSLIFILLLQKIAPKLKNINIF